MRRRGLHGSFWPAPLEELLLRAVLLDEERALAAWRMVRPRLDLDTLPPQPLRLMPLLWRRLRELGVEDPLEPRLRGLYRRTWFLNQVRVEGLRRALRILAEAGVPTLVLKGAALVARYYGDHGLRPMGDGDVLVRRADARAAMEALEGAGWARSPEVAGVPAGRLVGRQHAISFRDGQGPECDLHWQVSGDLVLPGTPERSSEGMWADAPPLDLDGLATRTLAPHDQLLHVCVHGARGHSGAHLQWVVDAATILRAEGDALDWEALLGRARALQASRVLGDALAYLAELGAAPVPAGMPRRLRHGRLRTGERLGTWMNGTQARTLGTFPQTLSRYARRSAGRGIAPTVAGLPAYVRDAWNLGSAWEVPVEAVRKVAGRSAHRSR